MAPCTFGPGEEQDRQIKAQSILEEMGVGRHGNRQARRAARRRGDTGGGICNYLKNGDTCCNGSHCEGCCVGSGAKSRCSGPCCQLLTSLCVIGVVRTLLESLVWVILTLGIGFTFTCFMLLQMLPTAKRAHPRSLPLLTMTHDHASV